MLFLLFFKNVFIFYCFWQSSQSLLRWDHNSLPGHIPPELSEEMPFRWTFQSQPIEHGWLTVRRPQEVGYKYTTRPHLKGNCKSGARRQSWKSSTDGSRNSALFFFFFFSQIKHFSLSCIFFETDADIFCFRQTPLSILITQVWFSRRGLRRYWITFVLGLLWETTSGLTACGDTEALMTFPTQSWPATHLSSAPFCNLEI